MQPARRRTAGFRFSATDAAVLAAGLALAAGGWVISPQLAGLVLLPVSHFFLFCNVFRVRRGPELVWTGCLLLQAAAWSLAGDGGGIRLGPIVAMQTPLTVLLIAREMRQPWYRGVFARRINPRLEEYLRGDY